VLSDVGSILRASGRLRFLSLYDEAHVGASCRGPRLP